MGLFEALSGHFADWKSVADVPEDRQRLQSVVDNLTRLFNSRRDSVAHLPLYGLPDLSQIPIDRDDGAEMLARAVEETVRRYEPRLHRPRATIEAESEARRDARLVLRLTGEIADGDVVEFKTTFARDGQVSVRTADAR